MTLKEYVLSYERDGKNAVDLFDYYDIFIKNLDSRFERYSYKTDKLVLCFFKDHEDVNPSMGYVRNRKIKGSLSCHCFGCGRTADIVRLHQILSSQYLNKELSEDEAAREVAALFDVPVEEEIPDDDLEGKFRQNLNRVSQLSQRYTKRDFSQALLNMRMSGDVSLDAVGAECVKMIATVKQLYD